MPPEKETADPVRTRSAAEESTVQRESYTGSRRPKTGRTRYLRIFPERATFLLDRLDDDEFVAAFRLALEYVIRDGQISDDDQALARVTKMPLRRWRGLKQTLIEIGVGRVMAGRWLDDDQQANLDLQNAFTARQREAAHARWRRRGDA